MSAETTGAGPAAAPARPGLTLLTPLGDAAAAPVCDGDTCEVPGFPA